MPTSEPPRVHHLAVQTADVDNSIAWYRAFFGCEATWELDRFSPLTHSRLPGIRRLVELTAGDLRFHVFGRDGVHGTVPPLPAQLQHVCMQVPSLPDLENWRRRWFALHDSGDYTFAGDDVATEIVVDDDGVASFYAQDVNGLEFEFTCLPGGA